jgi:hypothetical protein
LEKQNKQFNWQIKVLDQANRIIQMIGSSEDFDRIGDRVIMAGVQLANYKSNPIVLANHNYGTDEKSTCIGKTIDVSVVGSQLIFKIQFADTPNGQEWFYLYENKFMNASSIGFIPLESTPNNQGGFDFTQIELLEISMVAVPCNQACIQRAFKDNKISKSLFNLINDNKNETEVLNMTEKEVNEMIEKSIADKMEPLKIKHAEEISVKVKEIEELKETVKGFEDSVVKTGASISQATADVLIKACSGIADHCCAIKALVDVSNDQNTDQPDDSEGDPNDSDVKDYSEEEIQKMVAEKVEKMIKGEK